MKKNIKIKKGLKAALSMVLCVVMLCSSFACVEPGMFDFDLSVKADAAYTNTTIGRITQEQVVGVNTSIDGIAARDFWYNIHSNAYFDGCSMPTDIVIPGLGASSNYTPQGMTYWEEKNWILISAYDDAVKDTGRPSCVYAIDVETGKFVALFNIYNSDGTANTSHGGGIAVSEYNFYFADSGSNISYIPLSELDVSEGTEKNITIQGTLSFGGELNDASTSYCCYDDGVLWAGNFYYSGESSFNTIANASHNSMLMGYKLYGTSSQEEWDYLCGKYTNLLNVTTPSGTENANDSTITWAAYKNGSSVDVTGDITAPSANVGEFCPTFGSAELTEGKNYIFQYITNVDPYLNDFYIFAPNGKHTNIRQANDSVITKLEDGRWHVALEFTAGVQPNGADSSWSAGTAGTFTGTYTVRFDQDSIKAGEARDFAFTDVSITEANANLLKLKHTSGTASKTSANMTYSIETDSTTGSHTITGTATNTSGAKLELTGKYATLDLVEGETYTMSFVSNNQLTDAYIFAPSGANGGNSTHMRLFAQRGTSLGDGTYYYETTFTAGKRISGYSGGDYTWPAEQSTDGSFTGTYEIRFDQDDIQNNETRDFTISDINVKKVDSTRHIDRIHFAGTAGYPTYIIAIPNTANLTSGDTSTKGETISGVTLDKIQYAMVDNGRLYLSRSWNRIMDADSYTSEIDVFDICLDVPATNSLTINGATRSDCYIVSGGTRFYNLSMGEALCVIDDYLYTFTESAAYNYRQSDWDTNSSSDDGPTKVASQPIDVIWKIDQYAMMGEERLSNDKDAHVSTFEKITDISQIKYTDEYMIVYESETTDSNGQKIMYALDSYGGFKDGLVPKSTSGTQANTADSLGIVGHAISRYSIAADGETLTLYSPEEDDLASIRWKIIGAGTGAMRLENQDTYFGQYKNLYFGSRLMYMMPSKDCTSKLDHVNIKDNGDGTFSFYYKGTYDYYLWCNDGSNEEYMDTYTSYYNDDYAFGSSNGVKAYAGQTEQPGTFHSDAFYSKEDADSGNRMLAAVDEKYTKFSIYRRAEDVNITGENGLYTNMDAELQADGTYTLTLESYSTGQTVTKTTTEGKPIDFVFVLDTSGSMQNNSDISYFGISDNPEPYDYEWADDSDGSRGFLYGDDTYYWTWSKRSDDQDSGWFSAWYYHTINTYSSAEGQDYYFGLNSELHPQGSTKQNDMCVNYGFKKNPDKAFAGGYYWVDREGDATRLEAMKQSTLEFIEQIAAHAEKTGIQHRISIIQYGSTSYLGDNREDEAYNNTGMYSTTTGVTMQNYSTLINSGFGQNNAIYEYSFFPANHDNLEAIIRNISVSGDPDTFVDHGMTMALNTLADQMTDFNKDGDKVGERIYGTYEGTGEVKTEEQVNASACVINITDGIPGYGTDDEDVAFESAQGALNSANTMKTYDVDIYTVQMGSDSSVGSLSNSDFLNALSSNYIGGSTASKYDEGVTENSFNIGTSVGSGYYFSYDLSGQMDLTGFFENFWNSTSDNTLLDVETVTLNGDSILQHKLGDMFMLTDASTATAQTATISYDSLGIMKEETPVASSLTPTKDVANNKVQLTGFDYSTKYIADGNAGQKLYLTVENVLLNPDATASDFGINNQDNTAIYANGTDLSNNIQTQGFPQVNFTVPEYNYVSDFGLNMKTDTFVGTPVSVDYLPDKQETYATSISDDGKASISINGTTADECALNLGISPECGSATTGYTLVKRNDGGYYWAKVNVTPASNVYYEESNITTTTADYVDWTEKANSSTVYQDLSTKDDVYGYDSAYEGSTGFSNDSYYKAVVESTSTKTRMSDTATFTFTGTSFDLIGACGTNTGIQAIKVKDSSGKLLNSYIIDTYLSDESIMTTGDDGLLLHQVPILSYKTTTYDTYTVEVTAAYLSMAQALKHSATATASYSSGTAVAANGTEIETTSSTASDALVEELENMGLVDSDENVEVMWMDDNSIFNGGTGASQNSDSSVANNSALSGTANKYYSTSVTSLANYIDGFRIYNPMNGGYDDYIESEQNATYYNIVEELEMDSTQSNMAYIESGALDFITGDFNFDAYNEQGGPKGEIYLKANDAIAFTFTADHTGASAPDIMLGMRAVSGTATATTTVAGAQEKTTTLTSATEMYYPIATDVTLTSAGVTVIVKNTETGVLAVNNLKLVDGTLTSSGDATESSSATVVGGTASVPTPVVPTVDASQDDSDAPEADVENDVNTPETEVEDGVEEEADIAFEITGVPAPIASFLEMLFKFLGQLVSSFGF